jgi:hypothetical protein
MLKSFHPETMDEKLFVFNSETSNFSSWPGNQGIARRRTSVRPQASPKIDAAMAEKGRFRMKTKELGLWN